MEITRKHLVMFGSGFGSLVVIVIVVVPIELLLPNTQNFRAGFLHRCMSYDNRTNCPEILATFEKAYIGKSPCNVPVNAYDPLMKLVPYKHQCSKTLFWSKTKNLASMYNTYKQCFTLEASLLGSIMDDMKIWCGMEGSNEIYNTRERCPDDCVNNPVRSFWDRASAAFAEYACLEVTVLLDGSLKKPYDPQSTFGRVELKWLKSLRATHLTVILVTGKGSNCNSANIQELRKAVKPGIVFRCYNVPVSKVKACAANKNTGCAACLKA